MYVHNFFKQDHLWESHTDSIKSTDGGVGNTPHPATQLVRLQTQLIQLLVHVIQRCPGVLHHILQIFTLGAWCDTNCDFSFKKMLKIQYYIFWAIAFKVGNERYLWPEKLFFQK